MLGRTSNFIMASTLYTYCQEHPMCIRLLQKSGLLYIELQTMIDEVNSLGITNTYLLPNCRDGSQACKPHPLNKERGLKLLFFSTVNREKGVQHLFKMAEYLDQANINYTLDIYGEIAENYREEFESSINLHRRCVYGGVFDVTKSSLYKKINEYDLLLLPTKWKGESCIGVLVEAKMSGIPAIVSNHKYNSEIVINGIEGFVIDGDLGKGFAETVKIVANDEELYDKLAYGAYESRKRYDFATYKEAVRKRVFNYS